MKRNSIIKALALTMTLTFLPSIVAQGYTLQVSDGDSKILKPVATYVSGITDEDGGVQEIVAYNAANEMFYSVNGKTGVIDVINASSLKSSDEINYDLPVFSIDVKEELDEAIKNTEFKNFVYGDMTSVAISTFNGMIAVAVQAEDYNSNGLIVFLDYDGKIQRIDWAGKQPDMVTFSNNGRYVLAANEGEPREGYGEGIVDPEGSVTIIDLFQDFEVVEETTPTHSKGPKMVLGKDGKPVKDKNGKVLTYEEPKPVKKTKIVTSITRNNVGFEKFDNKIGSLTKKGVIIKKDSMPSVDFEPEYITIDEAGKYAYVTLQEANSIAKLDLEKEVFVGIYPLGFKDHSVKGYELDMRKDKKINIKAENVYGIYMPDAIASYEYNGSTYLVTANEGDAREWGDYINEIEGEDEVVYFDSSDYLGLNPDNKYIFGGRSFSIWKISEDGNMYCIYDSGAAFELVVEDVLPDFFNVSNSNLKLDSRSPKKGPEPEGVTVGEINGEKYAFIGAERIGGIFTFNITDPYNVYYESYINTRDFSDKIAGDVAPEGLVFVPAELSPTGKPMVTAAFEVSGTVTMFEVK